MPEPDTFENFRRELAQKVQAAEGIGMSQQEIVGQAKRLGDWLADEVDPRNREQRLLKELWDVSDNREREAIGSAIVKLVEGDEQQRKH